MRLLPERLKNHANFPEVVGIALLLLALLALGSILSYDSADPAYFFEAKRGESATSTWFGRVGATMAEALLPALGTLGLARLAAAENEAAAVAVNLHDLAGHLLAHEGREVIDMTQIDVPGRHEGLVLRDLHLQAALVIAGAPRLD